MITVNKLASSMISNEQVVEARQNLASLRAIKDRPLTSEEMVLGRKCAKLLASVVRQEIYCLREKQIEEYVKQGYTEQEARLKLRQDERQVEENIGLGKSKRCVFDKYGVS